MAPPRASFISNVAVCIKSSQVTSRSELSFKPFLTMPLRHTLCYQRCRFPQMSSSVDSESQTNTFADSQPSTNVPESQHSPSPSELTSPRYILGAMYLAFVSFTFLLGPGSLSDLGEMGKIFKGQLDDVNDIFYAVFNLMGGMAINYASLLNPGASEQKRYLPFEPFGVASIFFGFLALGPYLVGRNYVPKVTAEQVQERGWFSRILESRWLAIATVLFSVWCYSFAFGVFTPGTQEFRDIVFYASGKNLWRLIVSERGVSSTCIDFIVLSTLTWGPLTEDMSRRGWFVKGRERESILTAISFMLLPVFGPALYLATRPSLPARKK